MNKTTSELAADLTIAMLEHNSNLSYEIGSTSSSSSELVTARQVAENFLLIENALINGKLDD